MAQVKRRYLDMSIRSKLILWVILSVALTFVVILSLSGFFSAREAREKALAATMDLVLYENALVQSEQQYLYGVAAYYAMNREVQDLMRRSNEGRTAGKTLSSDLYSVSLARMHILGISFYDRSGKALAYRTIDQSHGIMNQDADDPASPINALLGGRYTYLWTYVPQGDTRLFAQDNSPKICLWYQVRDNTTFAPIGALCITLDTRKLLRSDYSHGQTYYSHMFILDSQGNTIIERGDATPLTETEIAGLRDAVDPYMRTGSFTTRLAGRDATVVYSRIDETNGYTTFAVISGQASYWSSLYFWGLCIAGLGITLLLLIPITVFISMTLSRPLNLLLAEMSAFKDGRRDAHVNLRYRDEIGRLGLMFNEMVAENNRLIEDTYVQTIRRQAAELTALSIQINPHFTYNMLNMIQWEALDNDMEEIAEIAYCTGQIFHLLLNHGSYFATLGQEQALLTYYLLMQQKRFRDRVTFAIEMDEGVLDVRVPKLLIQPLVENCVLHGVDALHPHIHIRVTGARLADDRVRIEVIDDGIGIPLDVLCLLPDGVKAEGVSTGNRYALRNIAERLRLFYGGTDFIFAIESEVGHGTRVVIEIPPRIKDEFLPKEEAPCSS